MTDDTPDAGLPAARLRESYKQARLARADVDDDSPESAYLRQTLANIESALVLVDGPDVLEEVGESGPEDHICVSGAALQQRADENVLAWETDEVRKVTDGGELYQKYIVKRADDGQPVDDSDD